MKLTLLPIALAFTVTFGAGSVHAQLLYRLKDRLGPAAGAILEFARNAAVTVFLPSTSTDSDKQISSFMRNATVEVIMNHLAALAGWTVTKGDGENPAWTFSRK